MNNNQFNSGFFIVTSGVIGLLERYKEFRVGIFRAIEDHSKGNWCETCSHDKKQNLKALETGERIFSSWTIDEHKIYIITEGRDPDPLIANENTVTTILLPSEH
ncbi:type I restriction endonuclease subunit M [Vibrio parahaemolyticus]|nr:type I restriction endonuclease subunit M [Vibrio parahaemolyticus]